MPTFATETQRGVPAMQVKTVVTVVTPVVVQVQAKQHE